MARVTSQARRAGQRFPSAAAISAAAETPTSACRRCRFRVPVIDDDAGDAVLVELLIRRRHSGRSRPCNCLRQARPAADHRTRDVAARASALPDRTGRNTRSSSGARMPRAIIAAQPSGRFNDVVGRLDRRGKMNRAGRRNADRAARGEVASSRRAPRAKH